MAIQTDPFELYQKHDYRSCLQMISTYLGFHAKEETQEKEEYLRLKRACEYRLTTETTNDRTHKAAREELITLLDQFAQSQGKTTTTELDALRKTFETYKDYESLHFLFSLFSRVYAQSNPSLSRAYLTDAKTSAVATKRADLILLSLWQLARHFYKTKSPHLIEVLEEILSIRPTDIGASATLHLYLMKSNPKRSWDIGIRLKSFIPQDASHYVDCITCVSHAYAGNASKAKEIAEQVKGKHVIIPTISHNFLHPKDAEFPKSIAQMVTYILSHSDAEIKAQFAK